MNPIVQLTWFTTFHWVTSPREVHTNWVIYLMQYVHGLIVCEALVTYT